MKGNRAAQNGGDPSAHIGRQLILEPWVAPLPNCTAPRGVRERDHCGPIGAPCRDGLGHRTPRCVPQRPPLSMSADQQRQFHPRQACQERLSPERGAPGWWRIIAAFGIGPRKAECHGGHTNTCVRIEGAPIQSKPLAQAVAGRVVERQSAFMHASPRRLAADQQPDIGGYLHHRARFMAELLDARAACANARKQRVKLRLFQPGGRSVVSRICHEAMTCRNVHQLAPILLLPRPVVSSMTDQRERRSSDEIRPAAAGIARRFTAERTCRAPAQSLAFDPVHAETVSRIRR